MHISRKKDSVPQQPGSRLRAVISAPDPLGYDPSSLDEEEIGRTMALGMSYADVSAAGLLELVAAHDERAWNEIVERYADIVWATARSHGLGTDDAVDVSQTVWLKLSQHIDRIRDPDRLGLWLHTTARNESLRLINQRSRTVAVDPHEGFATIAAVADPVESGLERLEQDRDLWRAFLELSERCRTLLRLLIADPPVPYKEIGEVTGIAVGSIGSRRQRCLRSLRAAMNLNDRLSSDATSDDGDPDRW